MEVAAIILAAGASTRMGKSKQRLKWGARTTLLTHAIDTVRLSGFTPITVVLGAEEQENRKSLRKYLVNIVSNPRWESGMGSSLKAGLKSVIQSNPKTDAILVMVCDQPFVTPAHLRSLIDSAKKPGVKAVFSKYAGTTGVPAVFVNDLFDEINALDDDHGAKKIARKLRPEEVFEIDLKDGEIDLDTDDQYQQHKPK